LLDVGHALIDVQRSAIERRKEVVAADPDGEDVRAVWRSDLSAGDSRREELGLFDGAGQDRAAGRAGEAGGARAAMGEIDAV
jgi:hypothetical protein